MERIIRSGGCNCKTSPCRHACIFTVKSSTACTSVHVQEACLMIYLDFASWRNVSCAAAELAGGGEEAAG